MSNKLAKVNPQNQEISEEVIIKTGTKKYVIKDEHHRFMGTFFWNPTDTGILSRYEEVIQVFDSLEPKEEQDTATFVKEADKTLIDKMSYLLNEDTSTSLFSKVTPLTMLANGDVYVLEVLNVISRLIEKEAGNRVKRADRKVNKYTRQYHK